MFCEDTEKLIWDAKWQELTGCTLPGAGRGRGGRTSRTVGTACLPALEKHENTPSERIHSLLRWNADSSFSQLTSDLFSYGLGGFQPNLKGDIFSTFTSFKTSLLKWNLWKGLEKTRRAVMCARTHTPPKPRLLALFLYIWAELFAGMCNIQIDVIRNCNQVIFSPWKSYSSLLKATFNYVCVPWKLWKVKINVHVTGKSNDGNLIQ